MPARRQSTGRRTRQRARRGHLEPLAKVPSGIAGLDEITAGGLPRGRATLVCGGPGCGKTLFGVEFLARGILDHGEPGVLMAFEEDADELAENVASLGFDLAAMQAQDELAVDFVRVERAEIEETGEYDLEGLFVRLQYAIERVGAKRVVLDTIEALFSSLPSHGILRSELRRLFRWLKERGLTVVITAEQGEGSLTRHGLEEYVSDCVIFLDNRVVDQASTRRLRIVKYRGAAHGTNEYPFLIDENGISILPVTSLALSHTVSSERVSTGVPRLDEMLGGRGFYRGTSILVSGSAGSGKTTVLASIARAACERRERCLYVSFEESPAQLLRNMRSVGIDLEPHVRRGTLRLVSSRPTAYGLEMHLVALHRLVAEVEPRTVVLDPVTNLLSAGTPPETRVMMTRLVDFLKVKGVTACFSSLAHESDRFEVSGLDISSVIDTWLLLSVVTSGGERNRTLTIVKARGMAHSNQAAEFRLSDRGVELVDTYLGPAGVLTGSARRAQEEAESAAAAAQADAAARRQSESRRRCRELEGEIERLSADLAAERESAGRMDRSDLGAAARLVGARARMAESRHAFSGRPVTPRSRR